MFGLAEGTAVEQAWRTWNLQTATGTAATCCNVQVWQHWNGGITIGTNAATAVNIWPIWNQILTAGTTANVIEFNTASIWQQWQGPFADGSVQAPAFIHGENEQQREARVAYELREAERRKVTEAERAIAAERARQLLLENLTEDQRRELAEKKHFHLRTRSGRIFRLHVGQGRSHNVKELTGDRIVKSYCAYPTGDIPEDDAILGQKLALEHDEGEFLRLAYSHDVQAAA